MKIGLIVPHSGNIENELEKVRAFGFDCCQIQCWSPALLTDEYADQIRALLSEKGITMSTFWCGWSGPSTWNFYDGPVTLGLIPDAYREQRVKELKRGAEFAARMGAKQMATHAGFLPEDPNQPIYPVVVEALREIAEHAKACGVSFLFETGQETPTTLKRVMDDIGTDNLGVNFDPANLLLYGKANPIDALKILGPHIMDVHAKDGEYPTDGKSLGRETKLGEGLVDFPRLIGYLKERGYDGAITIEREISGERQIADIRHAKALLEALI